MIDLTRPTPATDPEGAAAYAAVLTAVTRAPDPPAALRVASWVLASMADTLALLAFAQACDELEEAGTPHPDAPGPGEDFEDTAPETPADLRAECERRAVLLYAAILAALGGYDPAPAIQRYANRPDWPGLSKHWLNQYGASLEAHARCWGHYAVMEAVGHGVAWSDDNEPLSTEPIGAGEVEDPPAPANLLPDGRVNYYLPAVGDLEGVSAEVPAWDDAHTRAAWAKLDEAERRHAAERERGS